MSDEHMPLENLRSSIILNTPYVSHKSPQETVNTIARWFTLQGHIINGNLSGCGSSITSVPLQLRKNGDPSNLDFFLVASLLHSEFSTPLTITITQEKDYNLVKLHGTPKTADEKEIANVQERIQYHLNSFSRNILKVKQLKKMKDLLETVESLAFDLAEYNSRFSENW